MGARAYADATIPGIAAPISSDFGPRSLVQGSLDFHDGIDYAKSGRAPLLEDGTIDRLFFDAEPPENIGVPDFGATGNGILILDITGANHRIRYLHMFNNTSELPIRLPNSEVMLTRVSELEGGPRGLAVVVFESRGCVIVRTKEAALMV